MAASPVTAPASSSSVVSSPYSAFFLARSARRSVATKAERAVVQARAKKATQEEKIRVATAEGRTSRVQPISIAKAKGKARQDVKIEVDAKVAIMRQVAVDTINSSGSRRPMGAEESIPLGVLPPPISSSPAMMEGLAGEVDERPAKRRRQCEDMKAEQYGMTLRSFIG